MQVVQVMTTGRDPDIRVLTFVYGMISHAGHVRESEIYDDRLHTTVGDGIRSTENINREVLLGNLINYHITAVEIVVAKPWYFFANHVERVSNLKQYTLSRLQRDGRVPPIVQLLPIEIFQIKDVEIWTALVQIHLRHFEGSQFLRNLKLKLRHAKCVFCGVYLFIRNEAPTVSVNRTSINATVRTLTQLLFSFQSVAWGTGFVAWFRQHLF
jgi:hypothetical protein